MNLALTRLLAPILSFTCEEVWRHTKLGEGSPESVHLADFPQAEELSDGITAENRLEAGVWETLLPVRDRVLKALDTAREDKVIGASLEAAVVLEAGGDLYRLLESHAADLPAWFVVSQVRLRRSETAELKVQVNRARGDKCERCWKYTEDVGSNPEFPTVCAACASVLPEFLQ